MKTAPTLPVIDLATAKLQVRIDENVSDEDVTLQSYIDAATTWIEEYTGRSLLTQTWQGALCDFPHRFWLPRAAPLQSVTFVKYYDTANVLQTLATSVYTVPAFEEPASITLAYGQSWPAVYDRADAVRVEYVTGATSAALVPAPLLQAVQLLVGHFYANRESVVTGTIATAVPMAVDALCAPYRLFDRRPDWVAA